MDNSLTGELAILGVCGLMLGGCYLTRHTLNTRYTPWIITWWGWLIAASCGGAISVVVIVAKLIGQIGR